MGALQRCPHPHPRICERYSTMPRGVQVADGIKVVNKLTLKWEDYFRLLGRPSVIQMALKIRGVRGRSAMAEAESG